MYRVVVLRLYVHRLLLYIEKQNYNHWGTILFSAQFLCISIFPQRVFSCCTLWWSILRPKHVLSDDYL